MAVVLEPNLTPAPASESSERNFGALFAGVFVLVGGWPLIAGSTKPATGTLNCAGAPVDSTTTAPVLSSTWTSAS